MLEQGKPGDGLYMVLAGELAAVAAAEVRDFPDAAGEPQSVRFDDTHYDVAGSRLLAAALLDTVRSVSSLPAG